MKMWLDYWGGGGGGKVYVAPSKIMGGGGAAALPSSFYAYAYTNNMLGSSGTVSYSSIYRHETRGLKSCASKLVKTPMYAGTGP